MYKISDFLFSLERKGYSCKIKPLTLPIFPSSKIKLDKIIAVLIMLQFTTSGVSSACSREPRFI